MMKSMTARWFKREDGYASLEFVILFPLIILIFCVMFETAVLSVRQAMLNVAMEDVTRELRISSGFGVSHESLVQTVCESAQIIPDCKDSVLIEIAPVDTATWQVGLNPIPCINRYDGYTPPADFMLGSSNTLMMVRVCAVFDPIFPNFGIGPRLAAPNEDTYAIYAAAAYANEPI